MRWLFLIISVIICSNAPAEEVRVTDIVLFPGAQTAMMPTVFDLRQDLASTAVIS